MRMPVSVSRIALVAIVLGIEGFALASGAVPATNARPPILVIDRHAIVMGSKLGQDIHRQIVADVNQVQTDFGTQGQQLQSQMQALQLQPISPQRDKKMEALQLKEADFRQKVQTRQNLIQGGEMVAQQRFTAELTAVVNAIMQERGAGMVLEKSTVFTSVSGLDITNDAIQRLDGKITNFKVPLVNPPTNNAMQMQ
jgi:Skp family chaperone for outer membrane proteins